jgi:hypothetical protein
MEIPYEVLFVEEVAVTESPLVNVYGRSAIVEASIARRPG